MSLVEPLISVNPFPGLRAFSEGESDRFFGRERQIEEIVTRLDDVQFVAVTGSSGCGKSSLVRAGVLSELERHAQMEGGREWRCAVLRPGNRPIANLAEQLSRHLGRGADADDTRVGALYGRLRLGGLGLVEAVSLARLDPHVRVLVVVDQFEELFRFQRMTDPDEASAFVKLLLNAAHDPRSPVSVIITLRSDSLGFCADFRDLPEAISRGQYLVPRLTREQRKDAIVKPVELRGFKIAPRLVQRVLNDVTDNFDDLPIMQHVLTRTWSRWAQVCTGDRPIDLEDYESVGTAQHALSNHADEALESLPGLGAVVERVFRAVTERVADGREIRRPLEFDRLCAVVNAPREDVERVVDRFRRPDTAFLMPPLDVSLASNPIIDISHESLIRQWERLRGWTQTEAESRAILLRLVDAAQECEGKQDGLWQGQGLTRAIEWEKAARPTPAWVGLYVAENAGDTWQMAESFLVKSAEEASRQQRRSKRLALIQRGLAAAVVVISLTAAIVMSAMQKKTMSRELTNQALLEAEPALSARLALAALDRDPANARAEYALGQALANLEIAHTERILPLGEPVRDARYTRDGSRFVTANGKTVRIYDTRTFESIGAPITRDAVVSNAWLIAANRVLVTQTEDGRAQIQRLGDSMVRPLACTANNSNNNSVFIIAVAPDERHIALGCYDGDVHVWDVTKPSVEPETFARDPNRLATATALTFSASGEYLASGDAGGIVKIFKLGRPGVWLGEGSDGKSSSIRHTKAVRDLAFHPDDPNLLATAGDDSEAIVWQLNLDGRTVEKDEKEKTQPKRWLLKHERPVILTRFVPRADNRSPRRTIADKTARLWVTETADVRQARGHDDWVTDANTSADGELLVTASSDGTARVWSTRSGAALAVLRGHRDYVTRAVITPDASQIATASLDGTVRIWRVQAPRLLVSTNHWILSAQFDPDGRRVALGEEGRASLLERDDKSAAFKPDPATLQQRAQADALSFITWSHDQKYLGGIRSSHGISSDLRPTVWDVERRTEITPKWLSEYHWAWFVSGNDELLTIDAKGRVAVWPAKVVSNSEEPMPKIGPLGEGYDMASMSPDGTWIAAFQYGRNGVALWDRRNLKAGPRMLERHKGGVKSAQFSRDSRWLVTASADRTALIWPVDASGPPKELSGGHTAALQWASFDPTGQHVVTASADTTIVVWDTSPPKERAALHWHGDEVNQVEFSPDGKWILSASDDGTVKVGQCEVCSLGVQELRRRVEKLAYLPEDEQRQLERQIDRQSSFLTLQAFWSKR